MRSLDKYFHGYSTTEQDRLIRQADYWRHKLIPHGLNYQPGDRVLEIGCAVGASLAVLADKFPDIYVAGVDVETTQIRAAKQYLSSCNVEADLRVADASALPAPSNSYDHVFIMWFVEHLKSNMSVFREALRVLRPGGSITVTETDYASFDVYPPSSDWEYVSQAQLQFFEKSGTPHAGPQLDELLRRAGFTDVKNKQVGFTFTSNPGLAEHVQYVAEFIELGIENLVELGHDEERLRLGLDHFRNLPSRKNASFTQAVYRAHGIKTSSNIGV